MNGIYHKVGIRASADAIYQALTTQAGLAGWWTRQVDGTFSGGHSVLNETIRFDFGPGGFDMRVQELSPEKRVAWECETGPEDWIGSHIEFDLRKAEKGDMTLVFLRHRDWKAYSEFTAHCSMKWATFLLSLKELVETGRGRPAPDDLKIDDFN